MTSDQMIDLMRDALAATAITTAAGIKDRRAILGALSIEDLGAVAEFLESFTSGAIDGSTAAPRA